MSSLITDFVALTDQEQDLLNPIEFRTIVSMIRGILNSYQFRQLDGAIKQFYIHLNSKDPLFQSSGVDFYTKVVENAYLVYVKMTATPLNLADFKTQIAPTLGFVELIRRIVLNRYLYDQVKAADGSVLQGTYSVYLSTDYRVSERYPNPVGITFPTTLATETDFIKFGWNGNTQPIGFIYTSDTLVYSRTDLPVIFSTTADSISVLGANAPVTIPSASNDLTIHINYSNTPTVPTTLLTLQNGVDTVSVVLAVDKTVSILLNTIKVLATKVPSADGKVVLIVDAQGYLSIQITDQMSQLRDRVRIVFKHDTPLTTLTIPAPYRNQFTSDFGLRSVVVYQGFEDFLPPDEIVVPLGYNLLVDSNGRALFDRDGVPLMDVDIDPGADERGNFTYLTDSDGSYLMDETGAYYIVPADSFYVIIDDDGSNLLDNDGALLIEQMT